MSSAAVRSVLRSPSLRNLTARIGSEAKTPRSPFRAAVKNPLSHRHVTRSPVEMSFCMESMLPYHTATASALMTSMLSVSCNGRGWLSGEPAEVKPQQSLLR